MQQTQEYSALCNINSKWQKNPLMSQWRFYSQAHTTHKRMHTTLFIRHTHTSSSHLLLASHVPHNVKEQRVHLESRLYSRLWGTLPAYALSNHLRMLRCDNNPLWQRGAPSPIRAWQRPPKPWCGWLTLTWAGPQSPGAPDRSQWTADYLRTPLNKSGLEILTVVVKSLE